MLRAVAVLLCCVSWSQAVVCPTGYSEWKGGCSVTDGSGSEWRSEEMPPRKRSPAWERGEVKAVTILSSTAQSEATEAQVKFALSSSTGKPPNAK